MDEREKVSRRNRRGKCGGCVHENKHPQLRGNDETH